MICLLLYISVIKYKQAEISSKQPFRVENVNSTLVFVTPHSFPNSINCKDGQELSNINEVPAFVTNNSVELKTESSESFEFGYWDIPRNLCSMFYFISADFQLDFQAKFMPKSDICFFPSTLADGHIINVNLYTKRIATIEYYQEGPLVPMYKCTTPVPNYDFKCHQPSEHPIFFKLSEISNESLTLTISYQTTHHHPIPQSCKHQYITHLRKYQDPLTLPLRAMKCIEANENSSYTIWVFITSVVIVAFFCYFMQLLKCWNFEFFKPETAATAPFNSLEVAKTKKERLAHFGSIAESLDSTSSFS